jgi:glycerol-3-phosphate dehydrogenase (NAD(P)+)
MQIAVLGGGSFGTALAQLVARRGADVRFWMRNAERAATIQRTRHNPDAMSEFELHPRVVATASLDQALAQADWVVLAVPSQSARAVLEAARSALGETPLVLAAKGIENDTLMTLDEVVVDVLGEAYAARTLTLSGPSFAREILLACPTAVVIACRDGELADRAAAQLSDETFRAYSATDVVGVELGGALKNVMAIASGAVTGLGMGDNTRAALMTRGLAEMTRFAVAKGAHPMTLAGLAGFGDLVLTCTGGQSRNRAVGQALGEGKSVEAALAAVKQVAEGVRTAKSAHELALKLGVDAPITHAVYQVLYEGLPIKQAVYGLLTRPTKRELEY